MADILHVHVSVSTQCSASASIFSPALCQTPVGYIEHEFFFPITDELKVVSPIADKSGIKNLPFHRVQMSKKRSVSYSDN